MKKALKGLFLTLIGGVVVSGITHGLSFGPDTIFLDASNKTQCEAMNGSWTEWYEETYCTQSLIQNQLTETDRLLIDTAGNRITKIIGSSQETYDMVIELLINYEMKFDTSGDLKKKAIAQYLIQYLSENTHPIPTSCVSWYDGCNMCSAKNGSLLACTEMACMQSQTPECRVYEYVWTIAPYTAECTGEGSMECLLYTVEGEDTESDNWMYFYDSINGFDYQAGTEYTIRVRQSQRTGEIPADGSSLAYDLVEILNTKSIE